jgi:hypothetical protein
MEPSPDETPVGETGPAEAGAEGASPSTARRSPLPPNVERYVWQGKIGPAFWTVASVFSLAVNIFLIAILILVGRELFSLKSLVSTQLIGGLYKNFVRMDDAHIVTTIQVEDTIQVKDQIPVVFTLPLQQDTQVVLTRNAPVKNATIFLNGAAVPLDIILKKGTALDIRLDMTIPVSQSVPVVLNVPVNLTVPVDIPLNQTELHEPFLGLRDVVAPYNDLLKPLPDSWQETSFCGSGTGWLCRWIFGEN